jgi:20S proteasome alpha/beta subunit
MTIALGVLASDGVVLAADTEYTWGYLKTSGEKIWTAEADGAMAVTGAGASDYLEAISQQLLAAFAGSGRKVSVAGLERKFTRVLAAFHEKHVIPFSRFSQDQIEFWLVIALRRKGKSYLWATGKNNLRACSRYAAAGVGREYVEALFVRALGPRTGRLAGVDLAARLSAYAVFEAKRHVQYCGKSTSLVVLRDERIEETSASKIQLLDYHFNAYSDVQALGLKYALGFPYKDGKAASDNLSNYFRGLRQDMLATETMDFSGRERSLE